MHFDVALIEVRFVGYLYIVNAWALLAAVLRHSG